MEKHKRVIFTVVIFLFLSSAVFAQHFQPVWGDQNPQNWMNFVFSSVNIDGSTIEAGDEIAVFDTDASTGEEICVGSYVLTSSTPPFSFSSGENDGNGGFTVGDSIIYRLWDSSASKEIPLIDRSYTTTSDSVFTVDGTAVLNFVAGYSANTWTGTTDNNWNDASNWNTGLLTLAGADVIIPSSGVSHYPTLTTSEECNNLTIQSDASGDGSILGDEFLTVNGNAIVFRYITGGKWHDISAVLVGQTVNCLYFGGTPDVWLRVYNEPDNSRTYITDTNTPMPSGAGFEVWVEAGYSIFTIYTGQLQTSDVVLSTTSTPALYYTTGSPQSDYGYNLIGNPFASPLDLDNGTWNPTDVSTSFWIWDPAGSGTYLDYNTATKTGTLPGGIVPVGQGFFIQANGPTPSITIPMDARVHSAQGYYKNAGAGDDTPVHISLQSVAGEGNDEMNIAFLDGATEGFDTYDTRKMFAFEGDAPQVYSIMAGEDFGINGLPVIPAEGTEVKVGYKAGLDGGQTIIANLEFLPETTVLLEDLVTGDIQDLVENPVYEFDASTGDDPGRFILHFNQTLTGAGENPGETGIHVYAYDNALYIRSEGELAIEKKEIMVYDMSGRKVLQTTVYPSALNRIPVKIQGYFVVKIKCAATVSTTRVYIQ
ncbi:MAG TPA: hypothetical protein ENH02_00855 [Bacteroidetes bacterium]|nr:hypothetical protein [Bacteroidota bacterium]